MVGDVNSDALRKAWKASVRAAHSASLSSSLRSVACHRWLLISLSSAPVSGSLTLP